MFRVYSGLYLRYAMKSRGLVRNIVSNIFVHPTTISCLGNRMRVASEETGSPVTTIGLFFEAGPRYEQPETNGFSLYFEHMAYKSFKNISKSDFEDNMTLTGVNLRASTGRDHSSLRATCENHDADNIINIFADVIFEFEMQYNEMYQEKCQILQDLNDKDEDCKRLVFDYLHQTAYQGTRLAQSVEGPSGNVKLLNNDSILQFMCERLQPWRMTLVSAGGLSHREFLEIVKQSRFGFFCGNPHVRPLPEQCRFTGSQATFRNDALPFAHVAVALQAPGFASLDYIPMLVASSIVGCWDRSQGGGRNNASTLAQAMSETGDCESFESFYIPYKDTGLWGIYFVSDGKCLDDVLYNVQAQWMKLCACVTQSDLERGVNATKTMLARKFSDQQLSCRDLGLQVLYTSWRKTIGEYFNVLSDMKPEDIREASNEYIYDKCPAVAAVGPIESLPEYTRIRSRMYWLRL